MRTETDYKRQRNRCPHCGHRLTMAAEGTTHCTAAPGAEAIPHTPIPCGCGKHERKR